MRQALFIAAALGLSVSGCDFISGLTGGGSTAPPPVTTVPVPVPTPGSPSPSPFGQPTVAQNNAPRGILPPDLISSTDPNQRVQQVKSARNDPFALLPTTPSVQLPPEATTSAPAVVSPGSVPGSGPGAGGSSGTVNRPAAPNRVSAPNRGGSSAGGPNRSTAQSGSGGASGTAGRNGAGQTAPRSPIAVPIPRPDPTLAKAVQVTGVVQIGNQAYAIVNAPNEPTSRYVQEGQRLAGGQVLVRRIEFNRAEPVVILEQAGVEVVRAVGESAPALSAPATPTT